MQGVNRLLRAIDATNRWIGRTVAWLATCIVVAQFIVVVQRYVFGVGSIFLQESIIYMFAVLFLAGAGYTFLYDGHVRVDIFYRDASKSRKALVNLVGNVCFLIPVCALIWIESWPYVTASWAVLEGSRETSGIPGVFLLKSMILVFAALLFIQAFASSIRATLTLSGRAAD